LCGDALASPRNGGAGSAQQGRAQGGGLGRALLCWDGGAESGGIGMGAGETLSLLDAGRVEKN